MSQRGSYFKGANKASQQSTCGNRVRSAPGAGGALSRREGSLTEGFYGSGGGGCGAGCGYSLQGDFNVMGNRALCHQQLRTALPGNPLSSVLRPAKSPPQPGYGGPVVKEGYCASCRGRTPQSVGQMMPDGSKDYRAGMAAGNAYGDVSNRPTINAAKATQGLDYGSSVRQAQMKEGYCNCKGCGGGYDVFNYDMVEGYQPMGANPEMNFPTPYIFQPHSFPGNTKLSIEDPDNALTYWIGGPPRPCKSGPNEKGTKRRWLGVTSG